MADVNGEKQQESQPVSQTLGRQSPKPTNRDRYENKPMPELPKDNSYSDKAPLRKPYIQPAIPLVDPVTPKKNRAATDPIAPKPTFTRRPSVSQLRRKIGHFKRPSTEEKPSDFVIPTGKAAQVLGVVPTRTSTRQRVSSSLPTDQDQENESPAEARAQADLGDSMQKEGTAMRSSGHSRDDSQKTINASAILERPEIIVESYGSADESKDRNATDAADNTESLSHLAAPKIPTYGKVGERPAVQNQGLIRVESVQGIIEHAEASTPRFGAKSTIEADCHARCDNDQLPSISQLQNNYEGVWENDPNVGYSLPPFSPMPRMPASGPSQQDGARSYARFNAPAPLTQPFDAWHATPGSLNHHRETGGVHNQGAGQSATCSPSSFAFGNSTPARNSRASLHPSRPLNDRGPQSGSANSWANSPSRSSYSSANGPISAVLPLRWPYHGDNSVPSPPQNCNDYERPGSLAASFSQLDVTIHHHIDRTFGHLSKMVADSSDRTLDQIMRRLDGIEQSLSRNQKSLKGEYKNLNAEMSKMKRSFDHSTSANERMMGHVESLQSKMNACQTTMQDQLRQVRKHLETEMDSHSRHEAHCRSESANGALTNGNLVKHMSNMDRGGNRHAAGKGSTRSHHSNTSGSQKTQAFHNGKGTRKPILGGLRAQEPDIRDHPAYAGIPHPHQPMCDQNGFPLGEVAPLVPGRMQPQEFADSGWYQQAYGSH